MKQWRAVLTTWDHFLLCTPHFSPYCTTKTRSKHKRLFGVEGGGAEGGRWIQWGYYWLCFLPKGSLMQLVMEDQIVCPNRGGITAPPPPPQTETDTNKCDPSFYNRQKNPPKSMLGLRHYVCNHVCFIVSVPQTELWNESVIEANPSPTPYLMLTEIWS